MLNGVNFREREQQRWGWGGILPVDGQDFKSFSAELGMFSVLCFFGHTHCTTSTQAFAMTPPDP